MKALVFGGSGKIGSAVAWDLSKDLDVEEVGIVGRHLDSLNKVKEWIGGDKIVCHTLDADDRKAMIELMKQYDVGISAMPNRRTSYKTDHAAVEAGLSIVEMLEEYHKRPDPVETEGLELPPGMDINEYGDWLDETAKKNGVTFVDGMGFAPGLSNVTLGDGMRKLDESEVAIARVGGIPAKEYAGRHPLKYMITWAFEHVLREYMIKLNVIKNGEVVEVEAGSDREHFMFDKLGKNEELVCSVTPGMPSFLFTRPDLKKFAEKTVRWPGHWAGVDTLKECGLLDLEPVDVNGTMVIPRELVLACITPRLKPSPGETDVCVMYNTLIGKRDGKRVKIEYYMWDKADTKNDISSMMRVTGFPVAITAKMILAGEITGTGIIAPEDAITADLYPKFIAELKKREIEILEVETEL